MRLFTADGTLFRSSSKRFSNSSSMRLLTRFLKETKFAQTNRVQACLIVSRMELWFGVFFLRSQVMNQRRVQARKSARKIQWGQKYRGFGASKAAFRSNCTIQGFVLCFVHRQSSLLTWTILVHLYENYWNWNIAQLSDDSLSHFSFAMCAMSRVCTNKRRSSAKDIKVRPLNGIGCDLKAGHAECKFHAFVDPSSRTDFATEWIAKESQTLRLSVWFICAISHAIVDGEKKWKKIHKRNAELREIRAASDAKLPRQSLLVS